MEKLLYTVNEAVNITGLGRTTLYAYIKTGDLKVRKIGARTLITLDAIKEFLSEDRPTLTVYDKEQTNG